MHQGKYALSRRLLVPMVAGIVIVGPCPGPRCRVPAGRAVRHRQACRGAGRLRGPFLEQQCEQVVSQVLPSVVQISTSEGSGSGVAYDVKGDIVTNAHVVGTATAVTVTLGTLTS